MSDKQKITSLQKLVERQKETISNLSVTVNKLKKDNKSYKEALIKINGITMREIHDA